MGIAPLPPIMVAPNGARRTKADHPALPITIAEIVATASSCFDAGAGGLHAHVRDERGGHVLDAGLYSELITELAGVCPDMMLQITTEAIGRYSPEEQCELVVKVMPAAVSVALGEMIPDGETSAAAQFYHWAAEAEIAVQHILYSPDDLQRLAGFITSGVIPGAGLQILFVAGRYAKNQESKSGDLAAFLTALEETGLAADWALCAFGRPETVCLAEAVSQGGKVRVGFENSLWNENGTLARDNRERVEHIGDIFENFQRGTPGNFR